MVREPTAHAVRASLVSRLDEDLVGPMDRDEVLEDRPSDVYLTGILWPRDVRMGAEDDDGGTADSEGDDVTAGATVVGQQRPCSMGVSFATVSSEVQHHVTVTVDVADYLPVETTRDGRPATRWQRRAHLHRIECELPTNGAVARRIDLAGSAVHLELHVRSVDTPRDGRLSTVTLINRSNPAERDRLTLESLTLFQASMTIHPSEGTALVPRPHADKAVDEEAESARLLYRDHLEFAVGHQCSAYWSSSGATASEVRSTWIPRTFVPAFRDEGDAVFGELVATQSLSARRLALASSAELETTLQELVDCYSQWISSLDTATVTLPDELKGIAHRHIAACRGVRDRMQKGAETVTASQRMTTAFQLANAAMALQHSWKRGADGRQLSGLVWRPFQLGFVLLAAESTCNSESDDRETLDLLWFPTGGGKTEAYLAIISMLAWFRRLDPDDRTGGGGNAAVMRYTLRLLTSQQFERATALILACEAIRQGRAADFSTSARENAPPFSIGLWVGADATPNSFTDAIASRTGRERPSPEQLDTCPACGGRLRWDYDVRAECVRPHCPDPACLLGPDFGRWPVCTVDDDLYRTRPTLVIGTVDKFAQLPFRANVADLFGFQTCDATDLVIQDELHLISGPLGTVVGIYETAFDWLLVKRRQRPKVIGSTATIRRAQDQVGALFDRKSCQFPPPGLTYENSGFAVVDQEGMRDRLYVGVTTAGRSAKFVLQAVAGSLLQASGPHGWSAAGNRDGYATLLAYFNSLRELGGAIVQVLDDVPDSIEAYAVRRGETKRELGNPEELTSRVPQKEIIAALARLGRTIADPDCVDVVLATNMVSVGVDVPRLGLMLVNGQPKTRSEYIQATSRVGRSSYPGLVVDVMNAAKARDRSHFETFVGWHQSLYRDVEATSVTPFASRARDRALRAVLVAMIRHHVSAMRDIPNLSSATDAALRDVVSEIDRRVKAVDPREADETSHDIDRALQDWDARAPKYYLNRWRPRESLMQDAEAFARRVASGRIPERAWPVMNNMRSVEASTRFKLVERLADPSTWRAREAGPAAGDESDAPRRRWRV